MEGAPGWPRVPGARSWRIQGPVRTEDPKDLVRAESLGGSWDEHRQEPRALGDLNCAWALGNFPRGDRGGPIPQMILHPRENPYVFYEEYFEEDDEDE